MAYCTSADMVVRWTEQQLLHIADRDNDLVIDADVMAQAINYADQEINASLRGRYQNYLPLNPVPLDIQDISEILAFGKLHYMGAPVDVNLMVEHARKRLRDINKGDIDLGINPDLTVANASTFAKVTTEGTVWSSSNGDFI